MPKQYYVIALRRDGSRLVLDTLLGHARAARRAVELRRHVEGYTHITVEPARGSRRTGAGRRKRKERTHA